MSQSQHELLSFQRNEITEHFIYKCLAEKERHPENRKILIAISEDERRHYDDLRAISGREAEPDRLKIMVYVLLSGLLGLSFSLKLMEGGEGRAQENYRRAADSHPRVGEIISDEERHERELLRMIDEEKLEYTGSIVLGLNDALVELTGALAGFTLALQNTRLIAVVGLITGIAASLSMACSEYLSTKEEGGKNPLRASLYTGSSYTLTVAVLVLPFLIFSNPFLSLFVTLSFVVLIIFSFTLYISVAKELDFKQRFMEMVSISLGVAVINFFIGLFIRHYFRLD